MDKKLHEIKSKLRCELQQLTEKINNLIIFIGTNGFQKTDELQKTYLKQQLEIMKNYQKILLLRIANLHDQINELEKING